MPYFPLFVSLADRDVLIVGGGAVALRKARSLSAFGCRITAAAAAFCPGWETLNAVCRTAALTGGEPWLWETPWALVIAAAGDRALNLRVSDEARARGIPVNTADDARACTFYFPALVRRGDVVVGVCSGGKAPFYTKLLRKELEAAIPPGDGALPDVLETQREAARRGGAEAADRLIRTLRTALDGDPDLSASQLQALCEKFWQQTENYK